MKLILMADLHGHLPTDVPECDLLIIAGDISPDFRGDSQMGQARWLGRTFRPWLDNQHCNHCVAIWGNHDWVGHRSELVPTLRWQLLMDEQITINGLKIYGTPYVKRFYDWAFMENETQLARRWADVPANLDILVSHGPPYAHRDQIDDRGGHLGSIAMLDVCNDKLPKMVVCGHIHGGRGIQPATWGGTVMNVAGVDESYTPYEPMWMEVEL